MAKSPHQKLKLLRLYDILQNRTDEEHALSVNELVEALSYYGIEAERKSIYSDLEELSLYGLDIIKTGGKKNMKYYVGARDFELAELKLLVDAVLSSKFVSEKRSRELIGKLSALTSKYNAAQLNRQITVSNRNKTVNEQVLYNIDAIHTALQNKKMISFQYLEWNATKRLVVKKGGKPYVISPKTLIWADENYYLVAWDPDAGFCKHYRVDKMKNIEVLEEDATDYGVTIDPASYSRKMFGMYDGKMKDVTIRCPVHMIGILIDRFGKDISIRTENLHFCQVRVEVAVSNQFFGWLCGLGEEFSIIRPRSVADAYKEHLSNVLKEISKD